MDTEKLAKLRAMRQRRQQSSTETDSQSGTNSGDRPLLRLLAQRQGQGQGQGREGRGERIKQLLDLLGRSEGGSESAPLGQRALGGGGQSGAQGERRERLREIIRKNRTETLDAHTLGAETDHEAQHLSSPPQNAPVTAWIDYRDGLLKTIEHQRKAMAETEAALRQAEIHIDELEESSR